MLLGKGGRTVSVSSLHEATQYFASRDFARPQNGNPPDFLLDVIAAERRGG